CKLVNDVSPDVKNLLQTQYYPGFVPVIKERPHMRRRAFVHFAAQQHNRPDLHLRANHHRDLAQRQYARVQGALRAALVQHPGPVLGLRWHALGYGLGHDSTVSVWSVGRERVESAPQTAEPPPRPTHSTRHTSHPVCTAHG